jgi:hypothetical protein
MRCHACQREVDVAAGESVGFRAECEGCSDDLHVCLNCAHHDTTAYNECRESSAERVGDRDRANRCDYFRPGEGDGSGANDDRAESLRDLEALFGKS